MANQEEAINQVALNGNRDGVVIPAPHRFRTPVLVPGWVGSANENRGTPAVVTVTPEELDEERSAYLRKTGRVKAEEFNVFSHVPQGLMGLGPTVTSNVDAVFAILPSNARLRREVLYLCHIGYQGSPKVAELRRQILKNYADISGSLVELSAKRRLKAFVKSLSYLESLPVLQILDKDMD